MSTPVDKKKPGIWWSVGAALCVALFAIPWQVAGSQGASRNAALVLIASAALLNTVVWTFSSPDKDLPRLSRDEALLSLALAVFTLAGNLLSARSIQMISPGLLAVILRTEVIFVALLSWPLLGEHIGRAFWISMVIAACGLLLVQAPETADQTRALGVVLGLLAAACFSTLIILTRKYIAKINIIRVNALRLWIATGFWFITSGSIEVRDISAAQLFYGALAALIGPFLGRLFLMKSARYLEARFSALALLCSPALTVFIGYFLFGDQPTWREFAGSTLLILGAAIPLVIRSHRTTTQCARR